VPRYLGIDFGLARVGLALSDSMGIIAQPWRTIPNDGLESLVERICRIIQEENISDIVFGKPLHLSGDESPIFLNIKELMNALSRTLPEIGMHLIDERFTSVEAQNAIHTLGGKPSRDKAKVDSIAASLILQAFLESKDNG